jgi:hypothetical protein
VDASGTPQWTANGVALCTAANNQYTPTIVSDGAGGAIVTWPDLRSGTYLDIYAQRVERNFGTWGHPEPMAVSAIDVPSDQGGKVALNWQRSGHDVVNLQTISHYSVWRAVDVVALSSFLAAGFDAALVDPSAIGPDFAGTAVSRERIANTDYYWEWIGNQNAAQFAAYSFSASTRADSIAGDPAVHYFQVIAHTSNPYVNYKSGVVNGYSVDNLAPPAPLYLVAQRVGNDVNLKWNRVRVPDLRDYTVYRATTAGVTPVPINLLGTSLDTLAVDAGAPPTTLHYIVTAHDVHGNQSDPSNEAIVSGSTGVGNTPALTVLSLRQNIPNPFAGSTELQIGLPSATTVEIEVYDVAGRRVRSLSLPRQEAGWRGVAFDGRGDAGAPLVSGVYFYRVRAGGETLTRRMVIVR